MSVAVVIELTEVGDNLSCYHSYYYILIRISNLLVCVRLPGPDEGDTAETLALTTNNRTDIFMVISAVTA